MTYHRFSPHTHWNYQHFQKKSCYITVITTTTTTTTKKHLKVQFLHKSQSMAHLQRVKIIRLESCYFPFFNETKDYFIHQPCQLRVTEQFHLWPKKSTLEIAGKLGTVLPFGKKLWRFWDFKLLSENLYALREIWTWKEYNFKFFWQNFEEKTSIKE